jgi:hypothetical protein
MRNAWITATFLMLVGGPGAAAEDWGAVFRDVHNGYIGYGFKLQSPAAAEERAQRECRGGGKDCFLVFAVHGRLLCTAVATSDDNKDVYIAEGFSESDARAKALAACREGGSDGCDVDQALCAHRRPPP